MPPARNQPRGYQYHFIYPPTGRHFFVGFAKAGLIIYHGGNRYDLNATLVEDVDMLNRERRRMCSELFENGWILWSEGDINYIEDIEDLIRIEEGETA